MQGEFKRNCDYYGQGLNLKEENIREMLQETQEKFCKKDEIVQHDLDEQ